MYFHVIATANTLEYRNNTEKRWKQKKMQLDFLKHLILQEQINYDKLHFNFHLDLRPESELQKHHFPMRLYTWSPLKLA